MLQPRSFRFFLSALLVFLCLPLQAQWGPVADSVAVLTGFSPVKGNTMKVTKAGEEYMEWLLDDVKNATTSIEIE